MIDEKNFVQNNVFKLHNCVLQQNNPLNTLNDIHSQFGVTAIR